VQFAEYIQANVQLYSMRNNTDLRPEAVAAFVRGEIARALRTRRPYNVNLLLGGFDPITKKPSLYWCDYLAALAKVPYAAHGYAQYVLGIPLLVATCKYQVQGGDGLTDVDRYYCLSILDKHHHPDIDLAKGMEILRMCTDELKRRLPIDFKGVFVKVITTDGIKTEEYVDDKPVLPA